VCFGARLNVESVEVRGAEDFVASLPRILRRSPVAIVMIEDTLTYSYRLILAEFTLKNRVPAIVAGQAFAEAGGLMSYGARMSDLFRRAANQVDKVPGEPSPLTSPSSSPPSSNWSSISRPPKPLGSPFRNLCWSEPTRSSVMDRRAFITTVKDKEDRWAGTCLLHRSRPTSTDAT
jgi:hypothetical protein